MVKILAYALSLPRKALGERGTRWRQGTKGMKVQSAQKRSFETPSTNIFRSKFNPSGFHGNRHTPLGTVLSPRTSFIVTRTELVRAFATNAHRRFTMLRSPSAFWLDGRALIDGVFVRGTPNVRSRNRTVFRSSVGDRISRVSRGQSGWLMIECRRFVLNRITKCDERRNVTVLVQEFHRR